MVWELTAFLSADFGVCVFPGCFIAQGWAALLVQHWLLQLITLRGNQALGRMFALISSSFKFFFLYFSPRSCCPGAGALSNPLSLVTSVPTRAGGSVPAQGRAGSSGLFQEGTVAVVAPLLSHPAPLSCPLPLTRVTPVPQEPWDFLPCCSLQGTGDSPMALSLGSHLSTQMEKTNVSSFFIFLF